MPRIQNFGLAPGQIPLLSTTVTLNPAALIALATTPFTLVPAPGAGKILIPIGFAVIYNFGTIAYQGQDTISVEYGGAANDTVLLAGLTVSALVTAAASSFLVNPAAVLSNPNLAPDTNQVLRIKSGSLRLGGPIVTATKGAGGAGYAINDTGTIVDGSDDATYRVLTVDGAGAVLTFSVSGAGTAYRVENGVATAVGGAQPGVGVGFTVNITAVQNGDGNLKVVTYYQIVPVP
jgi:hypothetical protein